MTRFLYAALAVFGLWIGVAIAQEVVAASPEAVIAAEQDTNVVFYIGNIVAYLADNIKEILVTVLVGALAWAAKSFTGIPRMAAQFLLANFGERFIQNITDYAVNAVKGATKDAKLTVPVGHKVVAAAVARALELQNIDPWFKWLIGKLGGIDGVGEKVFRKIDMVPSATKENVLAPAMKGIRLPKGK